MKEAPPPSDLPTTTEELTLAQDQGRDSHAEYQAQAVINGEDSSGLSIVPSAERDIHAELRAMDRIDGIPESTPLTEPAVPTLVPVVGRVPSIDPIGDAIAEEVRKIETLTPSPDPSPEKPPKPSSGSMEYFAQRNASELERERQFSINPLTRAGNLVGGMAKKISDGMAKLGEGIENAEYERAVDAQLAQRTPSEVLRDRYDTFNRWNNAAKPETPVEAKVAPVRTPVTEATKIPPAGGPAEEKAREVWGMTASSESWVETESVESLAALAREIQLQEEELRIQEEELALRRRKLLLLQKKKAFEVSKKKNPPVPPKGPASAVRVA